MPAFFRSPRAAVSMPTGSYRKLPALVDCIAASADPESDSTVPRFLSEASSRALLAQIQAEGITHHRVWLASRWIANVRWARNRVSVASEWRDNQLSCGGESENANFNQVDAASLHAIGQVIQHDRRAFPDPKDFLPQDFAWTPAQQEYPKTAIWSDRTYAQTPDEREHIATQLMAGAERAGMLSAGYLSVEARGNTVYTQEGLLLYAPQTLAQCSMTVRDPQGRGSGWAGASSYDWGRFDAAKLADIALEKCLTSRNPVRIEPGRYTLIMEPQATFELASIIMRTEVPDFMDRHINEGIPKLLQGLPFQAHRTAQYQVGRFGGGGMYDVTRLGEKILDERLSLTFDPLDPDLGVIPFDVNHGDPYVAVPWITSGVLTNLAYDRVYALAKLQQATGKPNSRAFRMGVSGPSTSIEEMIATTKRGLLVTRFWGVELLDGHSMLCSGLTRDGLWLIENGKISHPVINLRFTESPLFAFNNVEQLGVPVPVFSPEIPAIVPAMKVQDFSFTALVDAI